jgi:hypothetical protein
VVNGQLGKDLGEVLLVPVHRVFDGAPAAHHAAGAAVQRYAITTRGTDGVLRPDLECLGHIPRARDDRPFPGWRVRHLQEGTDDRNWFTSDIHQGGQTIGFDEPVPGATAQITVQIRLKTSPHHRSHSGVKGTTTVLNRENGVNVK